ncbi:MAG: HEAT repeat domain-containing protein [Planctomycetia bacterium]
MTHIPSTACFDVAGRTRVPAGLVASCMVAVAGCADATPPKPQPARAVAAAPAAPARAESNDAPAGATGSAATPASGQQAAADGLAALMQKLGAASDKNARVLVIDDIAALGQHAKGALDNLVQWTGDEDPRTRWHAARAIGLIGEDALSALPTLITLLKDADPIVATQAAAAIGLIREDDGRRDMPDSDARAYAAAVDPLVQSTTHPDPRVRRAAVRALRRLTPAPEQLAPLLSKQLSDADPAVIMPALHTLADMDDDAVPFLIEALGQPNSRYWATIALAEIGPEAAPAVGPLTKLAAEGEIEEQLQAILALAAIGPSAATASPVLAKTLESEEDTLRFAAAFALGSLRAQDADAALAKAAKDDDQFLGEVVSWARARIHPDDKELVAEAVKRLRTGLHGERTTERSSAAHGLSDLAETLDDSTKRELVAEFADLLSDPEPSVGLSGGAALIRLGAAAVDTLRGRLSDPALKGRVLEILGAIGPAAKPALDDMINALGDTDPSIRGDAAIAIAALGPDAAAAVPALENILTGGGATPATKYPAAYALGRIGPAAKPALEELRSLTTSSDEVLATVAVWAALKIDPQDAALLEKAIPALRKAARAEQEIVRLEAVVALGDIGPAAASAIPILELVSEEDAAKTVRAAAAAALAKIKER